MNLEAATIICGSSTLILYYLYKCQCSRTRGIESAVDLVHLHLHSSNTTKPPTPDCPVYIFSEGRISGTQTINSKSSNISNNNTTNNSNGANIAAVIDVTEAISFCSSQISPLFNEAKLLLSHIVTTFTTNNDTNNAINNNNNNNKNNSNTNNNGNNNNSIDIIQRQPLIWQQIVRDQHCFRLFPFIHWKMYSFVKSRVSDIWTCDFLLTDKRSPPPSSSSSSFFPSSFSPPVLFVPRSLSVFCDPHYLGSLLHHSSSEHEVSYTLSQFYKHMNNNILTVKIVQQEFSIPAGEDLTIIGHVVPSLPPSSSSSSSPYSYSLVPEASRSSFPLIVSPRPFSMIVACERRIQEQLSALTSAMTALTLLAGVALAAKHITRFIRLRNELAIARSVHEMLGRRRNNNGNNDDDDSHNRSSSSSSSSLSSSVLLSPFDDHSLSADCSSSSSSSCSSSSSSSSSSYLSSMSASVSVCVVCQDRSADCVLLDCSHLYTCCQCSDKLTKCPVCRALIKRRVKVFKA